jgi:hypothetical protein
LAAASFAFLDRIFDAGEGPRRMRKERMTFPMPSPKTREPRKLWILAAISALSLDS